jgi:Xaa-Pro aminopeptidase
MKFQDKITALRKQLYQDSLDGFIIPRADEFQGEFVAPYAERLKWLTGFSGSAGVAIVLQDKAAVLSDGRYTIQLREQIDPDIFMPGDSTQTSIGEWLAAHGKASAKIGFDPWLHTPAQIEKIRQASAEKKISLIPVMHNLVDEIWNDQPQKPCGAVEIFPQNIAGRSVAEKKSDIARALQQDGVLATVIAMPDSVCWLLNLRGDDVSYLPVVLSYAVVYADNRPVQWIVDPAKLGSEAMAHIKGTAEIVAPERRHEVFTALAEISLKSGKPIALDFNTVPVLFKSALEIGGAQVIDLKDPCVLPRAIKTAAEQDSIRQAHIKDGAALAKFLCWLDQYPDVENLSEITIEEKLLEFRKADLAFRGPSFATIAGFAANGAIVHYRADHKTNKNLARGNLLLLDSGGQYLGNDFAGTTDITRTMAIGEPTPEMRTHFTLVLKGHIALALAEFSGGTTGAQIDLLARAPLQKAGLDYAHGTGHGVGCYLSVHEEAASISPRGKIPLQAGMLLSNEPGYYKEGAYGIRIENLVFVETRPGGKLGFETVTLAPIDRSLIVKDMLEPHEVAWLNRYHARVFAVLAPLVDLDTKKWLERSTAAVS